jgi:hypothetical protein
MTIPHWITIALGFATILVPLAVLMLAIVRQMRDIAVTVARLDERINRHVADCNLHADGARERQLAEDVVARLVGPIQEAIRALRVDLSEIRDELRRRP